MKLQQAFISETVVLGDWTKIGYSAPGDVVTKGEESATPNFTYKGAESGFTDGTAAITATVVGLTIANKAKLNDCAAGDNWTVTVGEASDAAAADAVKFTSAVEDSDCETLTPSFSQIGK